MHLYQFREHLQHGTPERPWKLYTLRPIGGSVFPCHWHPEWEFLLVERGVLELTRNQEVSSLGPGDAVFLSGSELHGGVSVDPHLVVSALVFHPSLARIESSSVQEKWIEPLELGTKGAPTPLRAGSRAATAISALISDVKGDVPALEFAFKAKLFTFLQEAISSGLITSSSAPRGSDPLPRIRDALRYIEEHLDAPVSVSSLAALSNLSVSHFSRLFKSFAGEAPLQYLIRCRLEAAAQSLRSEALSVSEVAQDAGFANFSHFSRAFRQHWGETPRDYRTRKKPPIG